MFGDGLWGANMQILVVLFKLFPGCQPTDLADHAYDSVWLCALEQAQEAGLALRAAAEVRQNFPGSSVLIETVSQSPRWNHGRHDLEVILPGMDRYPYEISYQISGESTKSLWLKTEG